MDNLPLGAVAALAGLLGGTVLGLASRLGDFCTLGALESAAFGADQRRLRLWGVVLGVAILGTHLGAQAGWIDIGATYYHSLGWNPWGSVAGGLVFGYGMAMAGNCGFGALVRFGGGDLRAMVVVLVMGITGFVTLSGPLAPLRTALFAEGPPGGATSITRSLEAATGLAPMVTAGAIAAALLVWALGSAALRGSPRVILWGAAAGLSVVWCLAATSWLCAASLGEVAVEGPSFTAPVGRTLLFLMTSTAGGISFSVGSVAGVMLGGLVGSLWRGLFRWEACEDPRELGRQVAGAALMGVGGIVAVGCSIGQGVTAFSTLAWSGPVTLGAIVLGGIAGLRQLIGLAEPD